APARAGRTRTGAGPPHRRARPAVGGCRDYARARRGRSPTDEPGGRRCTPRRGRGRGGRHRRRRRRSRPLVPQRRHRLQRRRGGRTAGTRSRDTGASGATRAARQRGRAPAGDVRGRQGTAARFPDRAFQPGRTRLLPQKRAEPASGGASRLAERQRCHRGGSGLHRERAHHRLPDRLPDLPSIPDHRPGGGQHPAGAGHDDDVAHHRVAAVQAAAVRADRRLGQAGAWPGADLHALTGHADGGDWTMNETLELTRQALWLVLMLSGPPIAAAAIVGLVVAFLQAATQIQEQTFAYALKFVAIVLALFVTGAMIGGTLYTYSNRIFLEFPELTRR